MRQYTVFLKKEMLEFTRTYRLLILFAVFMIIGIMDPLTAKLMPYLLENFMPDGMAVSIPDPAAIDSWTQFYKNVPQMGLIVVVLLFAGIVSSEYTNSTLVNMLTKGLRPHTITLSKVTVALAMWTGAYWCCFLITYGYTEYYWDQSECSNIFFAALCLWLFGVVVVTGVTAASSFFKNFYGSLIVIGMVTAVMYMISLAPAARKYDPLSLATGNTGLLNGTAAPADLRWSIIIALLLSIAFVLFTTVGIKYMKKKL